MVRWLAVVMCVLPVACGAGTSILGDGGVDLRPAVDGAAEATDAPVDKSADRGLDARAEVPGDDADDGRADAGTDAPADGLADAGTETAADALGDAGADGTNGDGGARPYVYLAMASTALMPNVVYPTDIVMVDVAAQRATLDTTLIGIRAMAYHDGKLLVARGAGYTRVSILNAETLAVERTQVLPWDPTAAVFSSDCAYLYAAHGDGYVAQVRMADGAVTADVLVPVIGPDSGGNNAIFDITISPSQTLLGTTTFSGGDESSVGLIAIAGETLALAHEWLSPQVETWNCFPVPASPLFDHTNRWLSTFDRGCGSIAIYDIAAGELIPGSSVQLAKLNGNPLYVGSAEDSMGRFWAVGYQWLVWMDPTMPDRHGAFPLGETAGILLNDPARTVYLWKQNPRLEGVFTIDPSTGNLNKLPWNLDLLSEQAAIAQAIWVER